MIGQILGRYLIVEEIGAGGMGVGYRALEEQQARNVALVRLLANAPAAGPPAGTSGKGLWKRTRRPDYPGAFVARPGETSPSRKGDC
jgi:hypothetical protein